MKNKTYNYIDLDLNDIEPQRLELIRKLVNEDIKIRKKARTQIVEEGKDFLPEIYLLFKSKNSLLRWEAAQVLKDLSIPDSIPQLLLLLDDEDMDIRWIASEGLIKTGRVSIKPLLEKLINMKHDSINLRLGVHHVFMELFTDNEKEKFKKLLNELNSNTEINENLSVDIHKALKHF